jgi:ADP-ribose pyrophosphatase
MSEKPMAKDPLAEELLESSLGWQGEFLRVYKDRVRSADGHVGVREYIRHPGAVMIVPLLDDGQVVLERQYRHPLRRTLVEFPAGKIDRGEAPLVCAKRELLEETGYRAAQWDYLGGFHNAIAYSDEKIEIFLARNLTRGDARLDSGEVLEVFTAPWKQLLGWTLDGTVTDVKTIVGAYWVQAFLSSVK